jgi:putative endonuclease
VRLVAATRSIAKRTGTGFAAVYRCKKLIYYEHYPDVRDVIAHQSQLKKWSREKKIDLINRLNPSWLDLES